MTSNFQYSDSRHVSHLVSRSIDPHKVLADEIGSAYIEYRKLWEEARTFKRLPSFPLHVDYEMRFACNLRCPMCLMSLDSRGRKAYGDSTKRLRPEKVVDLIKEGVSNGQKAMGFGGLWEPLLEPDLPDIVAEGRRLGLVDIMFNTNGLLLDEKVGESLIKSGLTRLMISLDADTAETYAQMRVGSDFDRVTGNIRTFMRSRKRLGSSLPLVRLSFCRTALNEHELEPFLKRWRDEVDFFSIQAYGRYPTASPPGFPVEHVTPPPAGRCAQPHKRLLLRHNGDVMPCCDASGTSLTVGNINQESLVDIWNGSKLTDLRSALASNELTGVAAACMDCQSKF